MIKSAIKVGLILVVGILSYNFFFGTPTEKEQSKEVFSKAKDITKSGWNLLKAERQKFKDGKYDNAVDKIETGVDKMKDIYAVLRDNAKKVKDSGILDKLDELEDRRKEIEDVLSSENPDSYDTKKLKSDWKDLMNETESMMEDIDEK